MACQDEGEFFAGQGPVVVGEADAAVELWVAREGLLDANRNSTPWVPRSNWSRKCSMTLADRRSDSSTTTSSTSSRRPTTSERGGSRIAANFRWVEGIFARRRGTAEARVSRTGGIFSDRIENYSTHVIPGSEH